MAGAASTGTGMTVLNTAELAGPPGTCSEPAAPAALISPAVQPPALRPHDPRWQPWLGQPRARDLLGLAGIALSRLSALAMISLTRGARASRRSGISTAVSAPTRRP